MAPLWRRVELWPLKIYSDTIDIFKFKLYPKRQTEIVLYPVNTNLMQCLFLQIQFYQNKFSKYQCVKWSCRRCILFLFFFSLPGNACGVKAAKKVIDPWPRKRWQKIHPTLVQEREGSLNVNIIGDFLGKRILIKYHTWKNSASL